MKNNKDYIGAIFLIFLGTMFLLNTTGVLSWSVWLHVLNYWPIFLILGGLRLILGRSLLSNIIISILALIAFAWIGVSVYVDSTAKPSRFFRNFPKMNYTQVLGEDVNKEFTVNSNDYENIETLEYTFNFGISEFNITDDTNQYLYVDANYTTEYGEPEITEDLDDEKLSISMTEKRFRGISFLNFQSPKYDISLGTDFPINIEIINGVGTGSVNLENQQLQNLSAKTGTGEIDITLDLEAIPTEQISLDVGTGKISLNLPTEVGYVINYKVGVGEINLGNTSIGGIGQNADNVKSDNYENAEKFVKIDANVGVGQLDVNFNN
jgi:hypothetical protein